MNSPFKIAVLGRGNIGGTLGAKWAAAGHQVVFGVRDVTRSKSRPGHAGADIKVETMSNAVRFGDIVVVAIPGGAVAEMAAEHGQALNDKIVIDSTNRFGAPVVNHIAEIAAAAPQATIYRAFNSLGWENFAEPVIDGQPADLFYCGPEGEPGEVVKRLIADVGLRPVRVGGIDAAPLVDNIGSLWVALVRGEHKNRHMAFRLLGG